MAKLRILYEAGPVLDGNKTGVGYYVHALARSLHENYPDQIELTGYYFNFLHRRRKVLPREIGRFHEIWLVPGKVLSVCRRLGFQPALSTFMRIPRDTDIVLFTNYVSLPIPKRQLNALVIYDLGFLDTPEFIQSVNLRYLQRFCPPSIREADLIVTISEFTKRRIQHCFPDIKARIVVTPVPPPDQVVSRQPLGARLSAAGIVAKQYILSVGTIEPRKNLQNLIKAYCALDETVRADYALVLAGGKGWKDEAILEEIGRQRAAGMKIILTGYVSDDEKAALYSNAACFVLPSHYEGFGMPILEAMKYGLPVAVSDIEVFREVADDAAIYFNKDDAADIARKLTSVLVDKEIRQRITQRGAQRLKSTRWQDNATKVYEAILR